MRAYVLVTIRAGGVRDVVKALGSVKGVVKVDATFGPYDAVAIVESEGVAELGDITAGSIQPIPGVERTLTCLAVEL